MSYDESNVERLLAQFRRKRSDRVPNFEEIIGKEIIEHILKKEVPGCTRDISPNDYLALAHQIGMDAIVFYSNQDFGGEQYTSAGDSSEQKSFYTSGTIKGWEDLERIVPVDIAEMLNRLGEFRQAVSGSNIGICVWVVAAFTRACLNMGYQDFMLKLYDDYQFVKKLIEIQLENTRREMEAVCSQDISFITIGDDLADGKGPMVSPTVLEELYFPAMKKIVQIPKDKGLPVMFHCCGSLDRIIPNLIRIGVDAVHPFQANCNDIYQIKKKYGEEICLVGNIGVTDPLTFGTQDDIITDVKLHIDNLAWPPGYVLCSDHSIADCIPPENFLAMIDAGHQLGMYSCDNNHGSGK